MGKGVYIGFMFFSVVRIPVPHSMACIELSENIPTCPNRGQDLEQGENHAG